MDLEKRLWDYSLGTYFWRRLLDARGMAFALLDQGVRRLDLGVEVIPLGDGEVEFGLWEVDEHAGNLGSLDFAHDLLDVLVDGVANELLLGMGVTALELVRHEHALDFLVVLVREMTASVQRGCAVGSLRAAHVHHLVHHLLLGHLNLLSAHGVVGVASLLGSWGSEVGSGTSIGLHHLLVETSSVHLRVARVR